MRVRVIIQTSKLPIIYRHRVLAFIKSALGSSNPYYKESLYENEFYTKKVKPFTFALLLPKSIQKKKEGFSLCPDDETQIEDYVFYPSENVTISLLISSIDPEFILNLYNGMLKVKCFPFNHEINLLVEKVLLMDEKNITSDRVVFKTYSPILIEDKEGKPVLKDGEFPHKIFNKEFNMIHDKILKDLRGYGLKREMVFEPVQGWKKQVVKHGLWEIRSKINKPYAVFTCFEGCFLLKGDPEDLNVLYKKGVGLRTSQGFGMVEVV
ncbi:MAG: CRISPR-associated endoribonuclease Cas6 [Aquificaceae bacterium]